MKTTVPHPLAGATKARRTSISLTRKPSPAPTPHVTPGKVRSLRLDPRSSGASTSNPSHDHFKRYSAHQRRGGDVLPGELQNGGTLDETRVADVFETKQPGQVPVKRCAREG